jgi:hypothetical protein
MKTDLKGWSSVGGIPAFFRLAFFKKIYLGNVFFPNSIFQWIDVNHSKSSVDQLPVSPD